MNSSIVMPSNMRSTAIVPNAADLVTGARWESAYARTTSPVRSGKTLFAISPTALIGMSSLPEIFTIGRSRMLHRNDSTNRPTKYSPMPGSGTRH